MRILVPAGIGDAYWVLVKLEAFCRINGISGKPAITILCDQNNVGHLRSVPFLEMVPFITVGNPKFAPLDPVKPRPESIQEIYLESFTKRGRTVYPGLYGYDYFMSYNGIINSGNWLEACDDLECNWYPDLIISKEQESFRTHCMEAYGKYAAFYWTFNGNYIAYQLKQFPLDRIAESIRQITSRLGLIPVFIGAGWDLRYNDLLERLISAVPGAVNLVGQTSLAQAFGAIRGSEIVIGYHCGLTNMAIMFKKKTVLLWPSSLPRGHWFLSSIPLAIAPPETRRTTYLPLFTGGLTVEGLVEKTTKLYGETN